MDAMFSFKLYKEVLRAFRRAAKKDKQSLAGWLTGLGIARCEELGIKVHVPFSD